MRLVRPGASELVRGRKVGFFCTRVDCLDRLVPGADRQVDV